MLVRTTCDHCQTIVEVSDVKLGVTIVCSQCDGQFVAQAKSPRDESIGLMELEPDVPASFQSEPKSLRGLQKHSLTLPPPPPEDWNETEIDEDENLPGQRFKPFQPRQRELQPFLDPDHQADDYSWMLIAGLIAFAVVMVAVFVGVIILFVVR